jgi:hypothetical protein
MPFFHQPLLIFIDLWLMSWGSLEMQTQVPPWLSNDMAKSYASLFISDMLAVLIVEGKNLIGTCIEASSLTTLGCCLMTMVVAFQCTIDRSPLISNICWYEDACHDVVALVILVLAVDIRVGFLENDESRHILAKTRWIASCFSSSSQLES